MVSRPFLFALCAGCVALLLSPAAPVVAQDGGDMQARHHGPQHTVTVSGEGSARAAPDEATVRFGVVTEAQTAEAARSQNAEASSRAMNAARELVDEDQIRLETLRLQPRYDYSNDERELIGYEAERTAVVEVDDLDVLPRLVARVVERGANRLEGISYDLSDRASVRREALQEAARDARDKAQTLAQSLDVSVGEVVQISERDYDAPQPRFRARAMAGDAEQAATPEPDAYAPGEIEVSADVQVTFALEERE
ncbi:MAG: SIMPL domain-containing protein [Bacteroidetes bacterium QS_9_68_14]|nr:MAG: SIMPL domain-containing protein [Bacteroidetes bacterium QS_9_68_14]